MAPLVDALKVSHLHAKDGVDIYTGTVDGTWCIGSVPQGGYVFGLALEACIQQQSNSQHPDPIHTTAHFLQATVVGPYEVHVRKFKAGRTFTNLLADLKQGGRTKIATHMIFGDLSPSTSEPSLVLGPMSPYARRLPLYSHPANCTPDKDTRARRYTYRHNFQLSQDRDLLAQNNPDHPSRTSSETTGGGGAKWGAWVELTSKGEDVTTASIPFFADMQHNLPWLLPPSEPAAQAALHSWLPTIVMTVEFKARVPSSSEYARRTVGLYAHSKFLGNPQGRHNGYVEVWTAPCDIGIGATNEGWREKQYCIAVADQMALILPMHVNKHVGNKVDTRL